MSWYSKKLFRLFGRELYSWVARLYLIKIKRLFKRVEIKNITRIQESKVKMFKKIINKTINKGYNAKSCELCFKDLSLL